MSENDITVLRTLNYLLYCILQILRVRCTLTFHFSLDIAGAFYTSN